MIAEKLLESKLTEERLKELWFPGAILHVARYNSFVANIIRKCLTKWQRRIESEVRYTGPIYDVAGNHDALCGYGIGTKEPGIYEAIEGQGSRWVSLETYCKDLRTKNIDVWLLWPIAAKKTKKLGHEVVSSWQKYIWNRPYDTFAFPRLIIKSLIMDWSQWPWPFKLLGNKAVGMRWAWYCTESVAFCWNECGYDIALNKSPTPLTIEHRCGALVSLKPESVTLKLLK